VVPSTLTLDLSGRVVAITGASSGIGEATARACSAAGAAVALAARRVERIERLARELERQGGRALALATDVGDEREARAFVLAAHERLGRLDALVCNAGAMLLGPVDGADTEQWRRMVDANLMGVLYCTHAAIPLMREQGSGHVVTISSIGGRRARAGSAVYNLTKFGVCAFSEALRQEVAPYGIRVTVIEPGAVETELIAQNTPAIQEQILSRHGETEPLEPADIALAIVYALAQRPGVSVNEVLIRPTEAAP
jgi:NADP-dependent 3-hydroxy acid dehydrogenase YdfG